MGGRYDQPRPKLHAASALLRDWTLHLEWRDLCDEKEPLRSGLTMNTEYRLYINDRYFGTYQDIVDARKQAAAQSCKWEIWKHDGTVLVAKGWTN